LGRDLNSTIANSANITFTNKYDTNAVSYLTSSGRDIGLDLTAWQDSLPSGAPSLLYDILGNPRTGSWDIGALEYTEGEADTIPSFSFTPVTNAELSSYHIGSAIFSGADSTFHVWSEADSFKVGVLSPFDIVMDTAHVGDTVFVPNVASGIYSTQTTKTIYAGGESEIFSVTTKSEPISQRPIARGVNNTRWKTSDNKLIKVQE